MVLIENLMVNCNYQDAFLNPNTKIQ